MIPKGWLRKSWRKHLLKTRLLPFAVLFLLSLWATSAFSTPLGLPLVKRVMGALITSASYALILATAVGIVRLWMNAFLLQPNAYASIPVMLDLRNGSRFASPMGQHGTANQRYKAAVIVQSVVGILFIAAGAYFKSHACVAVGVLSFFTAAVYRLKLGVPPAILLLASSTADAVELQIRLETAGRLGPWEARVVSLVDVWQASDLVVAAKSRKIFRTVDSGAWRDSVRKLASIVRLIVLDTRRISAGVSWEAGLVLCPEFAPKLICISDDLGGVPLLESMSLDRSAVTNLGAVVATREEVLYEIIPRVLHLMRTEALRRRRPKVEELKPGMERSETSGTPREK